MQAVGAGSHFLVLLQAPAPAAPAFKAPAAPDIKPDIKVPEFKAPDVKIPDFKIPEFSAPSFSMPKIDMPVMPKVDMPKSDMPKADAPKAPSFDMPKAPSFDMPKAPSFSTPQSSYDLSSSPASAGEDIEPQEARDEQAKAARSVYKEADETAKVCVPCICRHARYEFLTISTHFSYYRKLKGRPMCYEVSRMGKRRLQRRRKMKRVKRVLAAKFFAFVLSIRDTKDSSKSACSSVDPIPLARTSTSISLEGIWVCKTPCHYILFRPSMRPSCDLQSIMTNISLLSSLANMLLVGKYCHYSKIMYKNCVIYQVKVYYIRNKKILELPRRRSWFPTRQHRECFLKRTFQEFPTLPIVRSEPQCSRLSIVWKIHHPWKLRSNQLRNHQASFLPFA
jgi:hypothetical protein